MMQQILCIYSIFYGFLFASVISFAHVFTARVKDAYYEKSRKSIPQKWHYVLSGRSKCDHCQQQIPLPYVIPVFGYLLSLGKCSKCNNKISPLYLIEETVSFFSGFVFFYHMQSGHIATVFLCGYIFLCYFIAKIDYKYYIIPHESLITFLLLGVSEYLLLKTNSNFILSISVPISWFILLHLINYLMPGKLGLADIHYIVILTFAIGFPHSMYLPTLASFFGILYFFVIHRNQDWKSARLTKIPFGLFLSLAFLILKFTAISLT